MFNIALIDPKYPENVARALRLGGSFGAGKVFLTGDRVKITGGSKRERLPREERMRTTYGLLHKTDRPFDEPENEFLTPVAVEFMSSAELLPHFEHPNNALYVFGPEDGGLERPEHTGIRVKCERFVRIPTMHCLNLSDAISGILTDRTAQRVRAGIERPLYPQDRDCAETA